MTMNQLPQPGIVLQPGQGRTLCVAGDVVTFKAVGSQTEGKYMLMETRVEPQAGPPPHIHSREDEAFYIQAGVVEFQLDERTIVATPGTFLHSPKGQLHSFKNIGTTPAKMLIWSTPAGIEQFFIEVGIPMQDPEGLPPALTSTVVEKMLATAPNYGIEIRLN
ncbi:cupin domain-containing protein [Nostoc sp. 'Lobaria pulmonaria (5183) cyanobiont']|uniref:cupin domain-containing protein n=1 Tax=Nostoc sp. 'Lobaria pulmonaria (5183) cyanobiont' TaxID=1618022 RepID=UPI000CF32938|nr:cupin domain-containing protein [Nostoc sp. 'Lobaria pulmonaria (5183) cyanobiont']AVH71425.1 cupin [Nostoc sp. 'Lobaria pulmonaria (5183) cyanobiont']